jgi:Cu/Zn superoxide dismutase
MQNLIGEQVGTEHPAHIHEGGTCADDRAGNGAPVQYPLNSVITEQGGTGASTTEVSGVTVAQLFSGEAKYINVHAEQTGNETPPGIACADLSSRGGATIGATKQD